MLTIGRAIKLVREAKGLKISAVAKSADISVPMLSLIEKGEREPSLSALARIAGALEVPIDSFLVLSHGKTLKTTNSRAQLLADSIKKLAGEENRLREYLEGNSGHGYSKE